jgi:hypothetical protein
MWTGRVPLPPISSLLGTLPPTPVCLPTEISIASPPAPDDTDPARSLPYTVADDVSILRFVAAYYGAYFCGKIPWSFWHTYKRTTGSTRSTSSLYHHWNGAMRKKYAPFITTGRLGEGVMWLEAGAGTTPELQSRPPTGAPLVHHQSQPPAPLGGEFEAPRSLIRTPSFAPGPIQSFMPPK